MMNDPSETQSPKSGSQKGGISKYQIGTGSKQNPYRLQNVNFSGTQGGGSAGSYGTYWTLENSGTYFNIHSGGGKETPDYAYLKKDKTLSHNATRHEGVSIEDLKEYNDISNVRDVKPGFLALKAVDQFLNGGSSNGEANAKSLGSSSSSNDSSMEKQPTKPTDTTIEKTGKVRKALATLPFEKISYGYDLTGAYLIWGAQFEVRYNWLLEGKDASIFPYMTISLGPSQGWEPLGINPTIGAGRYVGDKPLNQSKLSGSSYHGEVGYLITGEYERGYRREMDKLYWHSGRVGVDLLDALSGTATSGVNSGYSQTIVNVHLNPFKLWNNLFK